MQDVSRDSFLGEVFSVDLGTVQQSLNNSDQIDQTRLITTMDALSNATASLQVPSTIFDRNQMSSYTDSPKQRLSYGLFLTGALFQTEEITSGRFAVGSIIVTLNLNYSRESAVEQLQDQQEEDEIIITFQKAEVCLIIACTYNHTFYCFKLPCFRFDIQSSEETNNAVCANFNPNGNGKTIPKHATIHYVVFTTLMQVDLVAGPVTTVVGFTTEMARLSVDAPSQPTLDFSL